MLKPMGNRVLVERMNPDEKTAGGLIIPDTAQEKPQQGTVIAVGPGKLNKEGKHLSMEVKAGDRVLFTKFGGTDVNVDGNEYLMLREDDIMAVVEG